MRDLSSAYRQLYDEEEAARQSAGWWYRGEASFRPLAETIRLEAAAIAGREVEWLSILPVRNGEVDVAHSWRESVGHRSRVTFSPAIVAGRVLRAGYREVVLLHNHPNGETVPSTEDSAAIGLIEAQGVKVIDHLIVGRHGALQRGFSFRESGKWPAPPQPTAMKTSSTPRLSEVDQAERKAERAEWRGRLAKINKDFSTLVGMVQTFYLQHGRLPSWGMEGQS